MKRLLIVLMLCLAPMFVIAEESADDAAQQIKESTDYLLSLIKDYQGLEQTITQLEGRVKQLQDQIATINQENTALSTEVARLKTIEAENEALKTASDEKDKLLKEILAYLQVPATFIQRIRALGIQ